MKKHYQYIITCMFIYILFIKYKEEMEVYLYVETHGMSHINEEYTSVIISLM